MDNLRSFRHFFRHAYSYELDERKVRVVLEDALKLKEIYQKDIHAFLDSLEARRERLIGKKAMANRSRRGQTSCE